MTDAMKVKALKQFATLYKSWMHIMKATKVSDSKIAEADKVYRDYIERILAGDESVIKQFHLRMD